MSEKSVPDFGIIVTDAARAEFKTITAAEKNAGKQIRLVFAGFG
jgi:Fe-S cluster assembly iron-binding protein IscA